MTTRRIHCDDPKPCGQCCCKVEELSVELGGRHILDAIDLHIHCGELAVIIGPNGAGKTTLFRALLGEVPYSGRFVFTAVRDGQETHNPQIGFVPQHIDVDRHGPMTVADLFAAACSKRPLFFWHGNRLATLARTSLGEVDAGHLLHQHIGHLSGGELQRVLLALALTPLPDILLLDEPVASMDRAGIDRFYACVSDLRRQHDFSVIMISHDLASAASIADRMIALNHEIVCAGPPAQVLEDHRVRAMFNLDIAPLPAGSIP
jgi:zinc transport system ATP-binding protein